MTDIAERASFDALDLARWERSSVEAAETGRDGGGEPTRVPVGYPGRIFVSVLAASTALLAAAGIGQDLQTSHWSAAVLAVIAWSEATVAVLALARPSRALFTWALLGNAVLAGTWAAMRLSGHGAMPGAVESLRVGLEVAIVLVAATLLLRPLLGRHWDSAVTVMASVLPVAVIAATTAVLVSQTPAPTAGHRGSPAPVSSAQGAQATVAVPGSTSSRFLQIASGNDTEKSELKPYVPLDPQTQTVLDQQLATAAQAAMRFPTVATAKAAGMVLAGGMAPGVGAHYQVLNPSSLLGINPDGSVNPARPASWIYASTADDAPVVGVMYESLNDAAPAGFAGPNDHWHQHSNLCITFRNGMIGVPFAPDSSVTPQECANVHGTFMKKTVWMVHAWVVPGWESPSGVFSHANTHIYCPGNTDLVDAIGFCVHQS